MKQEHIDLLKETLQQYGADYLDDRIASQDGKLTNVQASIYKGRIYYHYHGAMIHKLASSQITKQGIEKFVESYWYWSKK